MKNPHFFLRGADIGEKSVICVIASSIVVVQQVKMGLNWTICDAFSLFVTLFVTLFGVFCDAFSSITPLNRCFMTQMTLFSPKIDFSKKKWGFLRGVVTLFDFEKRHDFGKSVTNDVLWLFFWPYWAIYVTDALIKWVSTKDVEFMTNRLINGKTADRAIYESHLPDRMATNVMLLALVSMGVGYGGWRWGDVVWEVAVALGTALFCFPLGAMIWVVDTQLRSVRPVVVKEKRVEQRDADESESERTPVDSPDLYEESVPIGQGNVIHPHAKLTISQLRQLARVMLTEGEGNELLVVKDAKFVRSNLAAWKIMSQSDMQEKFRYKMAHGKEEILLSRLAIIQTEFMRVGRLDHRKQLTDNGAKWLAKYHGHPPLPHSETNDSDLPLPENGENLRIIHQNPQIEAVLGGVQ